MDENDKDRDDDRRNLAPIGRLCSTGRPARSADDEGHLLPAVLSVCGAVTPGGSAVPAADGRQYDRGAR
jgi:hypothetical protein